MSRNNALLSTGKPVNVKTGRTSVLTLPSGEIISIQPVQENGRFLMRINAPTGTQIQHLARRTRPDASETNTSDWHTDGHS